MAIDAVKAKLSDAANGEAAATLLAQMERLQSTLGKIGLVPDESEAPLRLPYSSMPTLRSKYYWK